MDDKEFEQIEEKLLGNKKLALAMSDEFLKKLNEQRPLTPPAVARLREEMKLENTFDSNAIEGSQLTLRETVLVVKEGVTAGNGMRMKDVLAAQGYAHGFDAVFDFVNKKRECDEALIKRFHQYVMIGELPEFCGEWRDHEVRVLGAAFKPSESRDVPQKMRELISWYQDEVDLHPIEKAARFHGEFEMIHPFPDGNGRTGRLLLNYMLVREGYWPVNIRYGQDRKNYYEALEAFQIKGDIDPLTALVASRESAQLAYCLKIALQQEQARQARQALSR